MIEEVTRLKEHKKRHNLTYKQLANAMDVSEGSVYMWLSDRGTPGGRNLYKIREYLEMAKKAETGVDRSTVWGRGTIPRPKGSAHSEDGIFSF